MNSKLTELFCPLKQALHLYNLGLDSIAASFFLDRYSEIVIERDTELYDYMRLVRPNDLVPTWTIAELGKALGNEIVAKDHHRLEVVCTAQYAGLRDERTDIWYQSSDGIEACFDTGTEAFNRAKLLIFCITSGFLQPQIITKTLQS
jgi:hypothetical protein